MDRRRFVLSCVAAVAGGPTLLAAEGGVPLSVVVRWPSPSLPNYSSLFAAASEQHAEAIRAGRPIVNEFGGEL